MSSVTINSKETLDLLKCMVCYDYMNPPIYQCREGHPVCAVCASKLKSCPTCRSETLDIRCRALDRLAESVKNIPCDFADFGCKKLLNYIDKKNHELLCAYRRIPCIHSDEGCFFCGQMTELIRHLISKHDYEEIQSNCIVFNCNKENLRPYHTSHPDRFIWQKQIYFCHKKYFLLRVSGRIGIDSVIFISLIALHSQHHSHKYKISTQGNHRKFSFEGPVWSIRKGLQEVERVRDCLVIPENIALFLSGSKGSENDLSLLNLDISGEILP